MRRSIDEVLAGIAAAQHGIFTGRHARLVGLTERQIHHRIETGQWIRLFNYAFQVAGAPLTWKGQLLAACWAGGFRAVASHRSAAALYGLAGGRQEIAEITCPRWRRARHPQVEVHETKTLGAADITVVDSIPISTPERTLFDLGAVCRPLVVLMAFDKARKNGIVTYESTEATLLRLARSGRPGVRALRSALSVRDPKQAPSESEMETLMLEVLRRHGLPPPVPQYEVRDQHGRFVARVDAAYPEARLAIEYQSYQEHVGPEPLVRDSRRRSRLKAVHWDVVDVTAPELQDGGADFCAAIRAGIQDAA
jgi:hypothetical protein